MALIPPRRTVLIVENEPSIHNVLQVLLAAASGEGEVAHVLDRVHSLICQKRFDAVMLDLRYDSTPQPVSRITELRTSMVGRILIVAGEADHNTVKMLERCAVSRPAPKLAASALWGRFRTFFSQSQYEKRFKAWKGN